MILDTLTITALLVAALVGGLNGYLLKAYRKAKAPKAKEGDIILGLRPSNRKARLRENVKTTRGRYTWEEKDKNGTFEADVHLDPDFSWTLGDGRTLHMVDLESFHVVRYEGAEAKLLADEIALDNTELPKGTKPKAVQADEKGAVQRNVVPVVTYGGRCRNDDDKTPIYDRFGKRVGEIVRVWARLPGTRINKIRKDHRINQINSNIQGWFDKFGKPIIVLGIIVACTLSAISLKMVWH